MSAILAWCKANPEFAVGIFLYVLSNVAVKLSAKPQTAGIGASLLWFCDLISIVPHKDARGVFGPVNLPLVPSKPTDIKAGLLVILLALGLSGCAYVSATGHALKTCAGSAIGDADWNDAKALADAALHLDRASAFAGLAGLAVKYGPAFLDCVVTELRADYGKLLTPGGSGLRALSSRAYENADEWLSRSKE